MHKELQALLQDVWRNRAAILKLVGRGYNDPDHNGAINYIYQLYTGSATQHVEVSATTYLAFLQQLAALENVLQLAPERQYSAKDWVKFDMGRMLSIYVNATAAQNSQRPWTQERAQHYEEGIKSAVSFFHYRKNDHAVIAQRIYMNIKRERRVTVFERIVNDLYAGPNANASVLNAKLTGPIDNDRADTVIIYLDSKPVLEQVLERIRYWQVNMGYACHFIDHVPKLTTPVSGLVGVATAQEPPMVYLRKERDGFKKTSFNQSYGFYRACLIFEALYQNEKKSESAFVAAVEQYFRKGGIDPDQPSLQGALDPNVKDV